MRTRFQDDRRPSTIPPPTRRSGPSQSAADANMAATAASPAPAVTKNATPQSETSTIVPNSKTPGPSDEADDGDSPTVVEGHPSQPADQTEQRVDVQLAKSRA